MLHPGPWIHTLVTTNSSTDKWTNLRLLHDFYLIYLIWYYDLSVKFVIELWIRKLKINKIVLKKELSPLIQRRSWWNSNSLSLVPKVLVDQYLWQLWRSEFETLPISLKNIRMFHCLQMPNFGTPFPTKSFNWWCLVTEDWQKIAKLQIVSRQIVNSISLVVLCTNYTF